MGWYIWYFIGVGIGLVLVFIWYFNSLVRLNNLMKEGWSGVEVQLKRRYDLIPRLVEIVKGYSKYEKDLLERVTRLRSQTVNPRKAGELSGEENTLSLNLRSLMALKEEYPDLKADQSFLELQNSLVEVENNLEMSRRYFNGTVRKYNLKVESFPGNLVASTFGFRGAQFFEIETAIEREAPRVNMGEE